MSENSPAFDSGLRVDDLRFAIVVSRFNAFVTDPLLAGAKQAFADAGADLGGIPVISVPGAWEIPVVAMTMAESGKYDALVCIGAVIRGDTPHFDYVAGEAARGIAAATDQTGVPIAFGVLTTNTVEQAVDRAGGPDGKKPGNKGYEAAQTALEMAHLLRRLRQD
jgi:6,7-dimethyl-8-ribityllumazine synthase